MVPYRDQIAGKITTQAHEDSSRYSNAYTACRVLPIKCSRVTESRRLIRGKGIGARVTDIVYSKNFSSQCLTVAFNPPGVL